MTKVKHRLEALRHDVTLIRAALRTPQDHEYNLTHEEIRGALYTAILRVSDELYWLSLALEEHGVVNNDAPDGDDREDTDDGGEDASSDSDGAP
jgi:hypothetical protein